MASSSRPRSTSDGTTLTGTASGRIVFTLDVDSSGNCTFTLFDQLDRPDPGVGNTGPAVEDVLSIDLSALSDFNGDTITLSASAFTIDVTIDVTDDIPIESGVTVNDGVDEEDLDTTLLQGPAALVLVQGFVGAILAEASSSGVSAMGSRIDRQQADQGSIVDTGRPGYRYPQTLDRIREFEKFKRRW